MSQAPQCSRSFEKQATFEACFAHQSICSAVISLHSGMSRAVDHLFLFHLCCFTVDYQSEQTYIIINTRYRTPEIMTKRALSPVHLLIYSLQPRSRYVYIQDGTLSNPLKRCTRCSRFNQTTSADRIRLVAICRSLQLHSTNGFPAEVIHKEDIRKTCTPV